MQESLAAMMFIMYILVVVVTVNLLSGGRLLSIRLKIIKPGSLDTKLVKYWDMIHLVAMKYKIKVSAKLLSKIKSL